jgi:hypothetical protein
MTKKTKGKAVAKAAQAGAKHPRLLLTGVKVGRPVAKAGFKAGKPLVKRRARQRVDQLDHASRAVTQVLAAYAPRVAQELGLAEPPKPKRTAPRVAVGVLIGASAMYVFEHSRAEARAH